MFAMSRYCKPKAEICIIVALMHKYVDSVVVEVPKSLILEHNHGKQEGYVMVILVDSH